MWEVCGSRRVAKHFASLDKAVKEKYNRAFEQLSRNPKKGKLLKGYENIRSFPVTSPGGEHRIIYRVKQEKKVVYVVLIGSREDVYYLLQRSNLND